MAPNSQNGRARIHNVMALMPIRFRLTNGSFIEKSPVAADELEDYESKRGLTIVPLSVYSDKRKLKVRLGVARGKKKFDKREVLKARDAKRHIDREMKNR